MGTIVAEDAAAISTVVPSGERLEPRSASRALVDGGIGLPGRRPLLDLRCGGLAGAPLHNIVPGTGRPPRLVSSSREALGRGASSREILGRRRGGEVVEAAGVEVGHFFCGAPRVRWRWLRRIRVLGCRFLPADQSTKLVYNLVYSQGPRIVDHGQGLLRAFDLFTDLAKILIKFKIRMKSVPLKGTELTP